MIVTTTGYIVSILGPYLSDSTNNDASILKHMIHCNTEELRTWLKEDDIFVVDRGFRGAGEVLKDIGIKMEIPSFMPNGAKQLSTHFLNISREVTKVCTCIYQRNFKNIEIFDTGMRLEKNTYYHVHLRELQIQFHEE
jgi:hypothetical protein